MLKNFIKDDGINLIFTGYYMEIYIPADYFDMNLAKVQGSTIQTFGLLKCRVFDNKNTLLSDDVLNLPTTIYLKPVDTMDTELNLIPDGISDVRKYKVCRFYKDNVIMPNAIQQDSSNVERFVGLILDGKIEGYIPYSKLLDIWEMNLELNNTRLNVPVLILGIILQNVYLYRKDESVKYGYAKGKDPKISDYMYSTANVRDICAKNSTFTAISFEDMDSMITSSINMKRYNKKQNISPIEKIIKM